MTVRSERMDNPDTSVSEPTASVIIPVYDATTLGYQLGALVQQVDPPPFEVVVSDNSGTGSVHGAVSAVSSELNVRVVDSSAQAGAAYARNVGVQAAYGNIVAFCDADDVVDPDWLRELSKPLLGGVPCISTGSLEHSQLNPLETQYAYGVHHSNLRDSDAAECASEARFAVLAGYLPSVLSSNFAVLRSNYITLGGMDVAFKNGAEDTDFGWRAQSAGIMLTASRACVHYRLRRSRRKIFHQQRRWSCAKVQLWCKYRDTSMVGPSTKVSLLGATNASVSLLATLGVSRAVTLRNIYMLGRHLGSLQGIYKWRIIPTIANRGNLPQSDTPSLES